jgi:hypothetical protein
MNEQVVNKGASFSVPLSTHTHEDRLGIGVGTEWQARSVAWLPTTRGGGAFGREPATKEKKVREVVPGQLGRRGVRTHRQRGDAAWLL